MYVVSQPLSHVKQVSISSEDDHLDFGGIDSHARVSYREKETHKSVEAAEEHRWECEYHLAENENTRLRHDIDSLETKLHAV